MSFSDRELLLYWEEGVSQSLIERSLRLIVRVFDHFGLNEAASLTIGDRDACLLHIRKMLFGTQLQNTCDCPQCAEKIEWQTSVSSLQLQTIPKMTDNKEIQISVSGEKWSLRLPNTYDVLEVLPMSNQSVQANTIIHRCMLHPEISYSKIASIPKKHKTSILENMEAQDPQANIEMEVHCPNCEHTWLMLFDIMSYLWTEIDRRARDLLQEVFKLAFHLGWSEESILDMTRRRRNWYLQQLQV